MKRSYYLFLLLMTLGFGQGCAVLRKAHDPELPAIPESYANADISGEFESARWWDAFEDDTLSVLIERAFRDGITLEQAAARLDRFRAMRSAANASLFPMINGSAGISDSDYLGDISMPNIPGFPANLRNGQKTTVSATASYEIDLWGKLAAGRKAAYSDLLAGEEDVRATVLSLTSQVARLYYQVQAARIQVDLLEKMERSYRDYLDLTRERYQRGVANSQGVYQAESNLASVRSQKIAMQATLGTMENGLSVLLGHYPDQVFNGKELEIPDVLREIPPGVPSELIQRRPDVRAAFHRMRAADYRWAQAVVNRYPSFSLTGNISGTGEDLENALDPDNILWNAMGNMLLPIFEGGRRQAQAKQAEAQYRELTVAYKSVLLNAFREVEDALLKGEKQRANIDQINQLVESREKTLRLATERYLQGVTDYLPVSLSQTAYFQARSSLITAKQNLLDDRIQLVTALGGDWMDDVIREYGIAKKLHEEK